MEIITENANTPNKERIKLWLDALRSGNYEQVHGALSKGGSFCCLGVACEVAIANGLDVQREVSDHYSDDVVEYDRQTDLLPHSVVNWFGLPSQGPSVTVGPDECGNGDYTDELAVLNDNGHSFTELADLIEKTYLTEGA